jgi:hypothetical protein
MIICKHSNQLANKSRQILPPQHHLSEVLSRLCSQGKYYDTSKNRVTSITAIQLLIVFKAKTIYK